jgi:hypothetical protein
VRDRCGERKKRKNEERRMKSEAREREREREDRERRSVREGSTVGPALAARVTVCIAVLKPKVHDRADSQCISVLSTSDGLHFRAGSGPLPHMLHETQ